MEVVEQLDFLITNTEVKELLSAVEREAKDTSFKRPPIACETSKHVSSSALSGFIARPACCPTRCPTRCPTLHARACPAGPPEETHRGLARQVLKYLGDAPSCNTTSAEVATLMQRLSTFAPLVRCSFAAPNLALLAGNASRP
jgi:hypothetical protein